MLFEPDADKDTNVIGMINPNCKVKGVINEAFQAATILCEDYYDRAPEIDIKGEMRDRLKEYVFCLKERCYFVKASFHQRKYKMIMSLLLLSIISF